MTGVTPQHSPRVERSVGNLDVGQDGVVGGEGAVLVLLGYPHVDPGLSVRLELEEDNGETSSETLRDIFPIVLCTYRSQLKVYHLKKSLNAMQWNTLYMISFSLESSPRSISMVLL